MGEPPHPKHLEKSLPVPIGMMQNEILLRSIPCYLMMDTTHKTVPSPPHTITDTLPLPLLSILLIAFTI